MSEQQKFAGADGRAALLNKDAFLNRLQAFLERNAKKRWCVAAVDIEHFKLFNEWYGTASGDKLLAAFAARIRTIANSYGCPAGYFGQDDFFLVLPDDKNAVQRLYDELQSCLRDQSGADKALFCVVLGVCAVKPGASNANSLCNCAQIAAASRMPGSTYICRFKNSMLDRFRRHQQLLTEVERGLQEHEFCFFLQPKCNSMTHRIIGMEALARWKHPERGYVAPAEFIPIMERSGLVTQLDQYIWESVCQTLQRWQREGKNFVPISVNVSIADISSLNIAQIFSDLVEKYQLEPKFLSVEITESMIAQNINAVQNTILALHRKGFTVLMDDFGSGYSSLNMLKDTSVDVLKLDMKFVNLTPENREKGEQIVQSMVDMAHRLNMPVVAEGVETQEQMYMLQAMDCLYIQGYYFYKPMTVEKAEELLRSRPSNEAYWDLRRDMMQRDHRVFGGNHVSERTAITLQAYQIVGDNVLELSRINLMTGAYDILTRDPSLPGGTMDGVKTFAEYCERLIELGGIKSNYAAEFLKNTNLEALRKIMFATQKPLSSRFRGANGGEPSPIIASILPCEHCSKAEPWAVILILDLPEA